MRRQPSTARHSGDCSPPQPPWPRGRGTRRTADRGNKRAPGGTPSPPDKRSPSHVASRAGGGGHTRPVAGLPTLTFVTALPAEPVLPPSPGLEVAPSPDLAPEPKLPPSPDLEPEPKLPPSPDLAPEPELPPSPGLAPAAALLPPAPLAALAARLLRSFFFFLSLLAKKLSRLRSSVSAMAAARMGGAAGGRGARGSGLWVKAGCALRLPGAASPQPRGVAEERAAGRSAPPPPRSGGRWYAPRRGRERRAGSRPHRYLRDEEGAHRQSARLTTAREGGRRAGLRRGEGTGRGGRGGGRAGHQQREAAPRLRARFRPPLWARRGGEGGGRREDTGAELPREPIRRRDGALR